MKKYWLIIRKMTHELNLSKQVYYKTRNLYRKCSKLAITENSKFRIMISCFFIAWKYHNSYYPKLSLFSSKILHNRFSEYEIFNCEIYILKYLKFKI